MSTRRCCRTWASRAPRSPTAIVRQFEKLLVGGIWCIVTLQYLYEENQKGSPFIVRGPQADPDAQHGHGRRCSRGARRFTEEQWIDALIRSTGMEPTCFKERVKWHLLARMMPLVENNYNLCELGPRGTGKSHIYKEISPNSILVSGGQTTVANLFYNMAARKVGLVGLWDVVAFDEVAGITLQGPRRRADHEGLHGLGLVQPGAASRSTPTPRWCSSATSTRASSRW